MSNHSPEAPRGGLFDARPWLPLTLALLVAVAAHQGALFGGFVWDDHALIEHKESVHELQAPASYFRQMFWSDPLSLESRNFYRPLVSLSFTLDWLRGAGNPFPFHVTNLLAHLGCVTLLFFWLRKGGASAGVAALSSALWATAPRLTESVSWICGRTDVFATLGVLGALVLWPFDASHPRLVRRVLGSLALLLGLFCKEVAVAGLAGIAVGELWLHRNSMRRALLRLTPALCATAIYGAARLGSQQSSGNVLQLGGWRPVFVVQTVGTYATMVLDSFRPNAQIGLLGIIDPLRLTLGFLVLIGLAVLLPAWLRTRPSALALCSTTTAVVGLGLVLHGIPLPVLVVACDRFLYLPLAMGSVGLSVWLERHRALQLAAIALVAAWSWSTTQRVQSWNDEVRLFAEVVAQVDPRNAVPLGIMGDVLLERHLCAEAARFYRRSFDAEERYDRERVGPAASTASPQGRLNLALALGELGQWDEAGKLLETLRNHRPTWARARYGQVMWSLRQHDWKNATRELDDAVADLGADQVSSRLRSLLTSSQREAEQLPPESRDEHFELRRRRLHLALELGGIAEAIARWGPVLDDERCDLTCTREGLAFLVVNAAPEVATSALGHLRQRLPTDEAEEMESTLSRRRNDLELVRSHPLP